MNFIYWFDLEETLIDSWNNPILVNIGKINEYIKLNNIKKINIFSYAIYGDTDKIIFDKRIKPTIEEFYGITVDIVLTVEDMMKAMKAECIYYESVSDFMSMNKKDWAFIKYQKYTIKNGTCCTLIDDVVDNMTLLFDNNSVITKNINTL